MWDEPRGIKGTKQLRARNGKASDLTGTTKGEVSGTDKVKQFRSFVGKTCRRLAV